MTKRYHLPIDKGYRISIQSMITQDLGYCCEGLFFSLYPQTTLIALRLGVSERAVRYHRAQAKRCPKCWPKIEFKPADY